MKDLLGLRSLGVVNRSNVMLLNRVMVYHAGTGEDILSTHVESVTQFKLPNDSHSVKFNFLPVVSGGGGKNN